MSAKTKVVRKILFVDDNPVFLDMVERVFSGWSKGSWQFLRASNAGKAMAMMEEHVVDLVIIDLHLPGVGGLQILRLLQKRFSNVPKVIMTGEPDSESEKACLSSGADLYLEKPKTLDGMEGVFATFNELSKWQGDQGFRGIMRQTTLPEILQLECLNKNSCVLEVISDFGRSQVFIREGQIIHAEGGGRKGTEALSYILALKGGEFNSKAFSAPSEVSIEGSWESLLLEAAQSSDEGGGLISPKLAARPTSSASLADLEKEISPAEAEENSPAGESHTEIFSEDLLAPRVDEMLLCSDKGDVMYEWQCPQPDKRIEFMEIVQRETQKLSDVLGGFDRFELLGERDHVLIRIKPDNRIFLRANSPSVAREAV